MIDKKFGRDVVLVIISNAVKLISSILAVFIVPLIFSQQDYGFYKLFLLYISYVGFFHFGFNDGIYLFYAGKAYKDLDRGIFNTYTKFLFIIQFIISLSIIVISFFFNGDRRIIISFVGLNLFALNFTTYYQFISQITQRFKEFATRNIIYTILNSILIGTFYLFKINDYRLFLLIIVTINYILLFWYMFTYRDITFKKRFYLFRNIKSITLMFKLGIILMLSNITIMLFSSIPSQFVDSWYPVETYPDVFSNFSFAYTLMGFTGVFLTAIGLVLYPTLRKSDNELLERKYNDLNSIVLAIVFILLVAYFPMNFIVESILPNYVQALKIFFILAPGIAITSAITVVIHNYYKSLEINKEFLIISGINIIFLIGSIYIVNRFISKDIIFISVATVFTEFIWYLSLDLYLNKTYKNLSIRNVLFIIASSVLFYLIGMSFNILIGFIVYGIGIILLILVFYSDKVSNFYREMRKMIGSNK